MQCLTNIVGVTLSENACILTGLTDDQKAAIKVSTSGLYLDDLPGGVHLKAVQKADNTKPFYDMATGALTNAAKLLETDLVVALNAEYKKSRKNFMGQLGRMSFAQTLNVSRQYQFIRLRPLDYSDAVLTLTRATIVINQAATFPIMLYKVPYKSAMGEKLTEWEVTTQANLYKQTDINPGLKLPFVENGELFEYWFIYDRIAANNASPKDNKLACSTCERNSVGVGAAEYLEVKGGEVADLNNLNAAIVDEYARGLILDVSIKCDSEKLFCNEYQADDAVAVTMAHAVRFKAGELLIEEVLKSTDINRFTTMDKERLWGKRNHFRSEYDGRIKYLAQSIDITNSNCYVCREQINQPFTRGIYS